MCIPDILKEIGEEAYKGDTNNLEQVMRVVFKKALNGEMKAIEYISERLEGKVSIKNESFWTRPIDDIVFEDI